jgi:hypothetical protein
MTLVSGTVSNGMLGIDTMCGLAPLKVNGTVACCKTRGAGEKRAAARSTMSMRLAAELLFSAAVISVPAHTGARG